MSPKLKQFFGLVIILILGLVFYFTEEYIRENRRAHLAETALSQLEDNYLQASKQILSLWDEGLITSYVRLGAVPESFWERLKERHSLVRGGAIFDSHGALVGKSLESIPRIELVHYCARMQGPNPLSLLTETGWFQVFRTADQTACLAAALNLPRFAAAGYTALYNPVTNQIYWAAESVAGDQITSELKQHLTLSLKPGEVKLRDYLVLKQLWRETGLIFIHITPARAIYKSAGFFVLAGSLVVFISGLIFLLLSGHIGDILRSDRESSRQILKVQQDTLSHLQQTIRNISQEPVIPVATSFAEYSFPSGEIPPNTVAATKEKVIYREKEPLVIELVATNRDFIFLDPDYTPPPAQRRPPDKRLAELREKAFNPEVIQLMKSVERPVHDSALAERIKFITEMSNKIVIPEWKVFLNEVYFDEITTEETRKILSYLRELLHSDAVALLRFNPYIGCYHTFLSDGLDKVTETNLYVLRSDPFFPLKKDSYSWHMVPAEAKESPYLKKRFSAKTLQQLQAYYAIPLHPWHIEGYLVGFFNQENKALPETSELPPEFRQYLKEAIPAFQYFFRDYFRHNYSDQATEMVKELRGITGHGRRNAVVVEIHHDTASKENNYLHLKNLLADLLTDNERLIYNSPFRYYLILQRTNPQIIIEKIKNVLPGADCKIKQFPEKGKNYYLYF